MPEGAEVTPAAETVSLSIVSPMFNEEQGITRFCLDLRGVLDSLGRSYEVLLVDDGSTDGSRDVALSLGWPELRVVALTHNVGHQPALEAGLSVAQGRWVITMDSDGQHPVSMVPQLLKAAETDGVDVVYTQRTSRDEDSWMTRTSALAYYRLMRWFTGVPISDSQADFRLVSRRVLSSISHVRGDRVLRMLLPYLGFSSVTLGYVALPRLSGESRYGVGHQVQLAVNSIFGFSSRPLRFVAGMGWLLSLAALAWLVAVVITWWMNGAIVGWTSVMTAVLFVGAMSLLGLSIVGAYLARIYDILKSHPRFVISDILKTDEQ